MQRDLNPYITKHYQANIHFSRAESSQKQDFFKKTFINISAWICWYLTKMRYQEIRAFFIARKTIYHINGGRKQWTTTNCTQTSYASRTQVISTPVPAWWKNRSRSAIGALSRSSRIPCTTMKRSRLTATLCSAIMRPTTALCSLMTSGVTAYLWRARDMTIPGTPASCRMQGCCMSASNPWSLPLLSLPF